MGETLYNGIRLPGAWPPRALDLTSDEPLPLPYLHSPPAVIPIDVGRQLFVDKFLVERTTLRRTVHEPEKYAGNPVLWPETPLELNRGDQPAACPFSDGIFFDPQDGLFKLWYMAGWFDGTALAVSRESITWERPDLDVVPGTNRVIAPRPDFWRDGTGVWLDHTAADPRERFKLFLYARSGTHPAGGRLSTSPDGIHWAECARTAGVEGFPRYPQVSRGTLEAAGGTAPHVPATVIVRVLRDDPARSGLARLQNEHAALELLSAIGSTLAPRFVVGAATAGTLVAEDLGAHPSLLDLLLGDNWEAAHQGLLAFARGLGTLHAQTARRAAAYHERRGRLGPADPDPEGLTAPGRVAASWQHVRDAVAQLGLPRPRGVDDDVEGVVRTLAAPGACPAVSSGDPSVVNCKVAGGAVRFFDFEAAGFRHALSASSNSIIRATRWTSTMSIPRPRMFITGSLNNRLSREAAAPQAAPS